MPAAGSRRWKRCCCHTSVLKFTRDKKCKQIDIGRRKTAYNQGEKMPKYLAINYLVEVSLILLFLVTLHSAHCKISHANLICRLHISESSLQSLRESIHEILAFPLFFTSFEATFISENVWPSTINKLLKFCNLGRGRFNGFKFCFYVLLKGFLFLSCFGMVFSLFVAVRN